VSARSIIAGVLLAATALASGYLFLRIRDTAGPSTETVRLGIGYYADRATLTGTDETGRILFRISASGVTQNPADSSVALQNVTLDYDPETEAPWQLRAETGRLPPGGKMIELSGNVVASTGEAGGPAAFIRTDFLEFDTGTRIAATDRKVVIEYAGSIINAVGLRADLARDRLELRSQVSGSYVR